MTLHEAALCRGKIQKKASYREKYLENLEVSEGLTIFGAQTQNQVNLRLCKNKLVESLANEKNYKKTNTALDTRMSWSALFHN